MAPERLDHSTGAHPAGDVYALGLVLFEAAVGRRPHVTDTLEELRRARARGAPPLAPLRPDLGDALCAIVDRCLCADPAARFADGAAVSRAVEALRFEPRSPVARRQRRWILPHVTASLALLLRALKLPGFARHAEDVAAHAERDGWTFGRYLHHLADLAVAARHVSASRPVI